MFVIFTGAILARKIMTVMSNYNVIFEIIIYVYYF